MKNNQLQRINASLDKVLEDVRISVSSQEADAKRMDRVIRSVFFLMGVLALLNFYFIYEWALGALDTVNEIQSIYQHLGRLGTQMEQLSQTMVTLGENIHWMPVMKEQMLSMSTQMNIMEPAMAKMQLSTNGMQATIIELQGQTQLMSKNMQITQEEMRNMGQSVHQMSRAVPR